MDELEDFVEYQVYDEDLLTRCGMLDVKEGRGLVWCVVRSKDYTFKVPRDIPYGPNFVKWFISDDTVPALAAHPRRFKVGGSSGTAGDAMEEDVPSHEQTYEQPPE